MPAVGCVNHCATAVEEENSATASTNTCARKRWSFIETSA
jgi:hypothetical protein